MNMTQKDLRTFLYLSLISVGLSFCTGCSKSSGNPEVEKGNKEYIIYTTGFSNLSLNEVKLTGKIETPGDEPILDHGFIVQFSNQDGEKMPEETISLGKTTKTGEITALFKPKKIFEQGVSYSYLLYVRTEKNFYKSNPYEFMLGNLNAVAEEKFSYGSDTIKINGNFEGLADNYRLAVRGAMEIFSLPFTVSPDKKSISFILRASSDVYNSDQVQVSLVRKNENPRRFELNLAKISYFSRLKFTKKDYDYSDFLDFSVANLADSYYTIPNLYILINGKKFPYQKGLRFHDLPDFSEGTFKIGYMNGKDSVYFPEPFSLVQPAKDLVLKSNFPRVHPFSYIQYDAIELSRFFWSEVSGTVGGEEANVGYDYRTGLLTVSPGDLVDGDYELKVFNRFHSYLSPKKVKVEKLKISSPTSVTGYAGDTLTLKGNFIDGMQYFMVDKNDFQVGMANAQEGVLNFVLNLYFKPEDTFQIGYYTPTAVFYKTEQVINYKSLGYTFDRFYPSKGTTGDILTVEGKGIGLVGTVFLGDQMINAIKINNNKVSFSIPRLRGKGKMKVGFSIGTDLYQSTDYFEYY